MTKKLIKELIKDINKYSFNEVKLYVISKMRFCLNEGEISLNDYENLNNLIMNKFNKEGFEL